MWLGGGLILLTASVVAIISWSADYIADFIPFSYEQEISSSFIQRLEAEDKNIQQYIQSLADQMSAVMQLPQGMVITAHYRNNESVNAFATLGGHIMINRGLLDHVSSENALAMVIAHEIAHIKSRDPIVAMGRGILIASAIGVLTGISGDGTFDHLLGDTGMVAGLHFSREQESDADREALMAMYNHYGHVQGATALFEYFQQQDADGFNMPELLRTHPASDHRVEDLQQLARQNHWPAQGALLPLPAFVTAAGE